MIYELMNGLSSAEREQVLNLGTIRVVPCGSFLFRLGDPADHLFLIERGHIRLTMPIRVRGREEDIFVEERTPGQAVGWSALIPPYRFTLSANAALLDAELIALPRPALLGYFAENAAAGCTIALNFAVIVGHRLQLFQTMWLREMQRAVEISSA